MRTLAAGVLVLVLTAALVLAGDFAIGLAGRDAAAPPPEPCIQPDERLHHRWKARCGIQETWGERTFEVRTNSLGNRDASAREVGLARGTARRVVLMGDSYTVCCLPWNELIVARMQRHAPEMEFHTAGMLSWSPTIYARRLRELIEARFQFDDLVVMIDLSDIQDEAAVYGVDARGALYEMHGRTALEHTGQPNDALHAALQRLSASLKLRRWFPMTHAVVHKLAWREPPPGEVPEFDRGAWTYRRSDVDLERRAYGALGYAGGIDKARTAMDRIAADARAAGIRLHVVVYPWPQQLVHDRADSLHVRIWRDWCAQAGCASFVDLFPALFAAKAQGGEWYARYFIPGDIHYNARGNEIIAGAISDVALRGGAR